MDGGYQRKRLKVSTKPGGVGGVPLRIDSVATKIFEWMEDTIPEKMISVCFWLSLSPSTRKPAICYDRYFSLCRNGCDWRRVHLCTITCARIILTLHLIVRLARYKVYFRVVSTTGIHPPAVQHVQRLVGKTPVGFAIQRRFGSAERAEVVSVGIHKTNDNTYVVSFFF